MKAIIAAVMLVFATTVSAEAVVKRVCHPDPKTGKEVCKNIKTHKKLEGTKVPEKQKKK